MKINLFDRKKYHKNIKDILYLMRFLFDTFDSSFYKFLNSILYKRGVRLLSYEQSKIFFKNLIFYVLLFSGELIQKNQFKDTLARIHSFSTKTSIQSFKLSIYDDLYRAIRDTNYFFWLFTPKKVGSVNYFQVRIKTEFINRFEMGQYAIDNSFLNVFFGVTKTSTFGHSNNVDLRLDFLVVSSFKKNFKNVVKNLRARFLLYSPYVDFERNLEAFIYNEVQIFINNKNYSVFWAVSFLNIYLTLKQIIKKVSSSHFSSTVQKTFLSPIFNQVTCLLLNFNTKEFEYFSQDYNTGWFFLPNLMKEGSEIFCESSIKKLVNNSYYGFFLNDLKKINPTDYLVFSLLPNYKSLNLEKKLIKIDVSLLGLNLILHINGGPILRLEDVRAWELRSWKKFSEFFELENLPSIYTLYLKNSFVSFFYDLLVYIFSNFEHEKMLTNLIGKCYGWVQLNSFIFKRFSMSEHELYQFVSSFCEEILSLVISGETYKSLFSINKALAISNLKSELMGYNFQFPSCSFFISTNLNWWLITNSPFFSELDPIGLLKNKPEILLLSHFLLSEIFREFSKELPLFFRNGKLVTPFLYHLEGFREVFCKNFKKISKDSVLFSLINVFSKNLNKSLNLNFDKLVSEDFLLYCYTNDYSYK